MPSPDASSGGLAAVLLDIDGTLLDSNDAHAAAWTRAFADHGYPIRCEQVRPLIGKGGDKLLDELVGFDDDDPRAEPLVAAWREHFTRDHLPGLRPTRGARALLERLRADGLRLVVATSAEADQLQALLRQDGVADLIDAASSSDDADASKPDPDIVRAAVERAGVAPGRCLMLGDTPYDIEAAAKAGVPTIALRCGGGWRDADFAGARAICDDPAALLERLDRLPLDAAG